VKKIDWVELLDTANVAERLRELYKDHALTDLAKYLGVSSEILRQKLLSYGIVMRPVGGYRAFKFPRTLLPDGWWNLTTEELVELTGFTDQYVRKIRREYRRTHGIDEIREGVQGQDD